jgi:subfamily B ATP-binding cassette protein MsbA
MKYYFRLLKYARPYIAYIIIGFIISVVISSVNVSIIPVVKGLIQAIAAKDFKQLNLFIAAAMGLYLLKTLCSFAQTYVIGRASSGIIRDLRLKIFEHLQDLSLDFYSKTRAGEIITIIMQSINMIQDIIVSTFTSILPGILTIAGISIYLFRLNFKLLLISLLIMPLVAVLSSRFGRDVRKVAEQTQEKASNLASLLHEVVTGAKIVKSFTMEQHEIKRFSDVANNISEISFRTHFLKSIQVPLFHFAQMIAGVIVVWLGGYEIVHGRMTPAELIAFFSGVLMLGEPIGSLSGINITMQIGLAAANKYFNILDTKPSVSDSPKARALSDLSGEVVFKDVYFRYDKKGRDILKRINFKCKVGQTVAIVGRSGAGKSTLVGLIPRFFDPTKGRVLIDGVDIKKYKILSLRKIIGIVPQETLLFSGSVKDNIRYGSVSATDEDIVRVAKMANAHEFIMSLRDKYDSIVGEKGARLSGGERQRIAIARAFLRDPKILILDEATSSLDSESERLVQDALEKLMKGRTTFVIAHRLSTVRFADRVIVLKKAEIVQEGSHEELIRQKGPYRRLYNLQFGKVNKAQSNIFGVVRFAEKKVKYGGQNRLSGWAISNDNSKIAKIRLISGGKVVGRGAVKIKRPKIHEKHPGIKHSLKSGFTFNFTSEKNPKATYYIEAVMEDGRKIRIREATLQGLFENPKLSK